MLPQWSVTDQRRAGLLTYAPTSLMRASAPLHQARQECFIKNCFSFFLQLCYFPFYLFLYCLNSSGRQSNIYRKYVELTQLLLLNDEERFELNRDGEMNITTLQQLFSVNVGDISPHYQLEVINLQRSSVWGTFDEGNLQELH